MSDIRRLVLTYGKNKGKIFELSEGENLIGRTDPDSEEPLAVDLDEEDMDAKVSRQHAVLSIQGDHATLEDLGSLNGTFIKKEKLDKLQSGQKVSLVPGDEIVVGKVSLRFE